MPANAAYGSTTRWVLVAIALVLLLVFLWIIRGILLLSLASIILVVLFTLPTNFLMRRGLRRGPATLLSLVFIVVLLVILFSVALPTLVQQFTVLTTRIIPRGVEQLIDLYETGDIQEQYPFLQSIDIEQTLEALTQQLTGLAGQLGATVIPVLGGVADTILSLLIVIFLSMYLLADPEGHLNGALKLFPVWYRRRAREIFVRVDETLRGWLRATVISMAFVGVATGILLSLLGIQQAAALGVLAGLLSFIPNFGPILALVPSVAVGIVQAPGNIVWIIIVIYGVSFIQSQIVGPLLVAGAINLPAVLVLLGQIVAGIFFGFLGIMLAVPLTAIIMVIVQEVYIKDILGDREVEPQPVSDDLLMPDGI
jgi:predicted PurR-regulated permease PerM